jgi:hypothetical protein
MDPFLKWLGHICTTICHSQSGDQAERVHHALGVGQFSCCGVLSDVLRRRFDEASHSVSCSTGGRQGCHRRHIGSTHSDASTDVRKPQFSLNHGSCRTPQ